MKQIWTKSTLSVHKLYSMCPPLAWTHSRCLHRHWSIVSPKTDYSRLHQTSMSCRFNSSTLWICLWWTRRCMTVQLHNWRALFQNSLSPPNTIPKSGISEFWKRALQFYLYWINRQCEHVLWHHYDVILTSCSSIEEHGKRYHQNFLLCNNNEITSGIAGLFNSFHTEVYVVAFFKVMQQQTVGKVANSITCCGQTISVCNGEIIIKIGQ